MTFLNTGLNKKPGKRINLTHPSVTFSRDLIQTQGNVNTSLDMVWPATGTQSIEREDTRFRLTAEVTP